jgi:hypothetical protein
MDIAQNIVHWPTPVTVSERVPTLSNVLVFNNLQQIIDLRLLFLNFSIDRAR